MKKSLMFPFLFAALLSLCACTQGTEADAPTGAYFSGRGSGTDYVLTR